MPSVSKYSGEALMMLEKCAASSCTGCPSIPTVLMVEAPPSGAMLATLADSTPGSAAARSSNC
jgi:hypothetical protein